MIFGRDPLANPEPLIRRVYAYVAYRIGEGPDAEDVMSETFERALRYRESYDAGKGEPMAWLIGIARRCIEGRVRPLGADPGEAVERAAAVELEDEVVSRLSFMQTIGSLDESDRELIALHYGADLSARRIGELLGRRTNAVEVALHRARAQLRSELDGSAVSKSLSAPVEEIGNETA